MKNQKMVKMETTMSIEKKAKVQNHMKELGITTFVDYSNMAIDKMLGEYEEIPIDCEEIYSNYKVMCQRIFQNIDEDHKFYKIIKGISTATRSRELSEKQVKILVTTYKAVMNISKPKKKNDTMLTPEQFNHFKLAVDNVVKRSVPRPQFADYGESEKIEKMIKTKGHTALKRVQEKINVMNTCTSIEANKAIALMPELFTEYCNVRPIPSAEKQFNCPDTQLAQIMIDALRTTGTIKWKHYSEIQNQQQYDRMVDSYQTLLSIRELEAM